MNKDEVTSSTIKISRKDIGNKTIPVICSWCNAIFRITEWEIEENTKIKPSHGICPNCSEKMREEANLGKDKAEE